VTGSSPNYVIKQLVQGTGITLTPDAESITIDATAATPVTVSNAVASPLGDDLVTGSSPNYVIKQLVQGTGITLTPDAESITIDATGGTPLEVQEDGVLVDANVSVMNFTGAGVEVTSSPSGQVEVAISPSDLSSAGGTTLVTSGTGPELQIKGLTAGSGIAVNVNANDLEIEATGFRVEDEGILVDANTTTLNFVGSGVTASTSPAGQVTVDIPEVTVSNTVVSPPDATLVTGSAPDYFVKQLSAGTGIALAEFPSVIRIDNELVVQNAVASPLGEDLVTGSSPTYTVKQLKPGAQIDFDVDADSITINATGGGGSPLEIEKDGISVDTDVTVINFTGNVTASSSPAGEVTVDIPNTRLTNAGGDVSLVNDGTGPALAIKGLTAGIGMTLNDLGTVVSLQANGANITLQNAGGGGSTSLVNDGTGPDLFNKGLLEGTAISFGDSATAVTINATGTNITLTNAGGDQSLVSDGAGPSLEIKGLTAGYDITLTSSPSTSVEISNGILTSSSLITLAQTNITGTPQPIYKKIEYEDTIMYYVSGIMTTSATNTSSSLTLEGIETYDSEVDDGAARSWVLSPVTMVVNDNTASPPQKGIGFITPTYSGLQPVLVSGSDYKMTVKIDFVSDNTFNGIGFAFTLTKIKNPAA